MHFPRYETDDNALAETKAELQAEIVSLEAAGPVAIRVEEGEAQPEPSRKKMTGKYADAIVSRCNGRSRRHRHRRGPSRS